MSETRQQHIRGVLTTLAAVAILSPDALLVRLISADPWTLIFWRGLLSGITILLICMLQMRGSFLRQVRAIGWVGLLAGLMQAVATMFFVNSLRQTAVANTLVILAAVPLFSAVLSRIFLKETITRRTWIAVSVGFGGIALLFAGSLGGGSLRGDLCAVIAASLWASYLVTIRQGRAVNMVPALGLGGLISAGLVWLGGVDPLAVPQGDWPYILMLGLFVLPVAFGLITLGTRKLPAPEVSLIMLLETPLGPFWVWLVLGERPALTTLVAGVLIVGTLVVHTLLSIRAYRATAEVLPIQARVEP
ncbi:MAG TPA: DMT family transporter [Desulfuromonadales bacterium]|nr:DMT family transporter [Desulfuromonadales bacterium]